MGADIGVRKVNKSSCTAFHHKSSIKILHLLQTFNHSGFLHLILTTHVSNDELSHYKPLDAELLGLWQS